jgi:hypothetical protein
MLVAGLRAIVEGGWRLPTYGSGYQSFVTLNINAHLAIRREE